MLRMRRYSSVFLTCATVLLGCATQKADLPVQTSVVTGQNCRRVQPRVGAQRADETRTSGAVALARAGKTTIAYIADADEPALRTVDVDTGREIATTALHGRPEQALVLADGRVAVTLRGANAVEILEPAPEPASALASRCVIDTPAEPVALATTPDDATLLVTTGWAHTLLLLDAATLAERFRVELAREPRAVVVSDDGARAFVSHVVGAKMSVVDLSKDARPRTIDLRARLDDGAKWRASVKDLRDGCQGFALAKSDRELPGRIFAPMVSVEPGDTRRPSSGYGDPGGAVATETGETPVVDASAERALTRTIFASRSLRAGIKPECLLPRASAYHAGSLYVSCLGIDAVVELDARAIDPSRAETRRWPVASGPTGLAVDHAGRRMVVFSQFDRQVDVIDLRDQGTALAHVSLSRGTGPMPDADLALGRRLFHQTHETKISKDGRACASCHPDGREDALTWSTPDGARQTPMLAGRLVETAPYGWLGANAGLQDHVKQTFTRLGGTGLSDKELTALLSYVRSIEPPTGRALPAEAHREELLARGRALFSSSEAACSTCHVPALAFSDGAKHDLRATPGSSDKPFDTPSLKFVSGTAPYFHDGRYATLDDLLAAPDHAMGHVLQLSHDDRVALAAYLESL
jgi:DNA-binding beta-propeller fold protein YncE